MKIVVLFLLYSSLLQAKLEMPEFLKGSKVVSSDEVLELSKQENVNIIDCRPLLEYSEGHIPGAISVPVSKSTSGIFSFNMKIIEKLKGSILIFYCNGIECPLSYHAIKIIQNKGSVKKLYWFREGMASWVYDSREVREGVLP